MIMMISTLAAPEDREYLTGLYDKYSPLMYKTAAKYLSAPEDREDVLQESLVRMINSVDRLRELDSRALPYYICAIVRNTAFTQVRAQWRRSEVEQPLLEEASPVDLAALVECRTDLSTLWEQLSEEDRFLLEGKYLLGYEDAELAKALRCKPGSIRMKLTRTRRKAMRVLYRTEGNDCDDKA